MSGPDMKLLGRGGQVAERELGGAWLCHCGTKSFSVLQAFSLDFSLRSAARPASLACVMLLSLLFLSQVSLSSSSVVVVNGAVVIIAIIIITTITISQLQTENSHRARAGRGCCTSCSRCSTTCSSTSWSTAGTSSRRICAPPGLVAGCERVDGPLFCSWMRLQPWMKLPNINHRCSACLADAKLMLP